MSRSTHNPQISTEVSTEKVILTFSGNPKNKILLYVLGEALSAFYGEGCRITSNQIILEFPGFFQDELERELEK